MDDFLAPTPPEIPQADDIEENKRNAHHLNWLVYQIFTQTDEGKELFAHWKTRYIGRPLFPAQIQGFNNDLLAYCAFQDGQSDVIRAIEFCIEAYKQQERHHE